MTSTGRTAVSGAAPAGQPRQAELAMVLWMVLLTALWGLNAVTIKILTLDVAPIMGAGLRGVVALPFLTAFGLLRGESLRFSGPVLFHGIVAALIFGTEFILVYSGAKLTNGGHTAIFLNTAPFFVAVGAHYLLPGDRLTWLRMGGLVLAFTGVVVLFSDDLLVQNLGFWRGDLVVMGGAMLWACHTLYMKRFLMGRTSAFRTLYVQMLAYTPYLIGVSLLTESEPLRDATVTAGVVLLYQGVIVVFLTYMMWMHLLSRYPASSMQSLTFMSPVWGVIAGVVLLGEHVSLLMSGGIVLVGLGLYLVNRPAAPSLPAAPTPEVEAEETGAAATTSDGGTRG